MALPMPAVMRLPSVLSGHANGNLPDSILVSIPGEAGGPVVRLVAPAARSFGAMCAAARAAGFTIKLTSSVDSYRPYSVQRSTFEARYTTSFLSGRPYKTWQGKRWYQRPGTAQAAVPGTSNHGLAIAGDIANASGALLVWLMANAPRFGFWWELASEPWHVRYCMGDAIPAAVLAYEKGKGGDDMGVIDDPLQRAQVSNAEHYLQALIGMGDALDISNTVKGDLRVPNELATTLRKIEQKLSAAPAGAPVTVDAAAVAAALAGNSTFLAAVAKAVNDDAAERGKE